MELCKVQIQVFDANGKLNRSYSPGIKILEEEKIAIHEFEQDLDTDLQWISSKKYFISSDFVQKHAPLFEGLPNCTENSIIDSKFESFLSKGIELWKRVSFSRADAAANEICSLRHYFRCSVPSGLLRFKVSDKITLGQTARHLFTGTSSGILPDACDGWMFVKSYENKIPAKILFNKQLYDAKDLPVAQYSYICGDPHILMLDLLAEFKGSDDINVEHDREKLIGELATASQCFIQILDYNPYVFGITTSGPQFRFYALRSTKKEKSYNKQSMNKNVQQTVQDAKEGKQQKKQSASKPSTFEAGDVDIKKEEEKNEIEEKVVEKEEEPTGFYDCFYLANMQISNFATYVQLLVILWRIRVLRSMYLRDYASSLQKEEDMAQVVPVSEDNTTLNDTNANLNNTNTDTQGQSNTNNSEASSVAEDFNNLKIDLHQLDLTFVKQFLNSNEDSLVVKALTSDSNPVVVKLYTNQEDYESEKKIYDWLERALFQDKPKLIQSFETKTMRGLVLECIKKQPRLHIDSEHALLSFTVTLLKTIEKLHACDVIHGDIKRSNLIYDSERNQVKLLDFGLSEILPKGRDYTHRRGQTPGFLRNYYQPMTFRDDLCNIGVVLCQLIYGVDPTKVGYDELLEMTKYGIAKTLFPVSDEVIWFTHAMLDITQVYDASYALQESLFSEFVQNKTDDN